MRASESLVIAKSSEAVWAFITQLDNWSKWFEDSMQDVRPTSDGDFGLGSTFAYTYVRGRSATAYTGRVTVFEPSRNFTVLNRGSSYDLEEAIELAPDGGGTHVTMSMDFKPTKAWVRSVEILLRPFGGLIMRGALRKNLGLLARALDASSARA